MMNTDEKYIQEHGLKKFHVLMRVEHAGARPHRIKPYGFCEDLRGELEICVFAVNEAEAEAIAYDAYKIACRDVDYVEVDNEDEMDGDGDIDFEIPDHSEEDTLSPYLQERMEKDAL
jgi:hypothetical protein